MPVITIDELKKVYIGGEIGAISIDTSVVERYQYGFESGVLAKMSQFSTIDVAHLALDIVLHELRSHLKKEAENTRNQVKAVFKPLGNSWGIDKETRNEALQILFQNQTEDSKTEERLQNFLDDSSATTLTCTEYVNLSEVLSLFNDTKPPFGIKEAKKHEFPDAIALLTLEAWAVQNATKVIAVSSDGDWRKFCAESNNVFYVDDLAPALSVFQVQATDAAALFQTKLRNGEIEDLVDDIEKSIASQLDKIEIDFQASSADYYEEYLDNIEAESSHSIPEQLEKFDVVEYTDNTLVLRTKLSFEITAYFDVNFKHRDSIDGDYLSMGSASLDETKSVDLNLIITVLFNDGTAIIDYVELLPTSITMDFGDIEPDWKNHSYDED